MADQPVPLRRYLAANAVALAPSFAALLALYWSGHLAGRPTLIAMAGIAVGFGSGPVRELAKTRGLNAMAWASGATRSVVEGAGVAVSAVGVARECMRLC